MPGEIDHQGIGSSVEFGEPGWCFYCYSAEDTTYYHDQDNWLIPMKLIAN